MSTLTIIVIAYLLGSLSFAIIVSKACDLPDPRSYGSANPGATNVLRTGHTAAAIATLVGDGVKGWLAVTLAQHFGPRFGLGDEVVAAVALAVFIGHLFPVFFRFKGGKGVATAGGILLGVNVWLGLASVATWLAIAFFFRYSSLAAVIAALFAAFYAPFMFGPGPIAGAVLAMALLLIWRHRANLRKLAAGEERRIGADKTSTT